MLNTRTTPSSVTPDSPPETAPRDRAPWLAPAVAFALAAIVYRLTAMRGVGFWDIAEFQVVPHILGIAHAPGYPTFTLLGKLATFWPEGSIAWRMNLFSGLCGAGAVAMLVVLARRLGAGHLTALGAAIAMAFHAPFWSVANRADPFPLHVLFVLGAFGLAHAWREAPSHQRLALLGVWVGLALGNHLQFSMVMPALAAYMLLGGGRRWLDWRPWAAAIGGGLAGLSVFAYLPLRAAQKPALNYMDPSTPERFWAMVSGAQFQQDMSFLSIKGLEYFLVKGYRLPDTYAAWLTPGGTWVVAALALAGLLALARRDWPATVGLVLAFLVPLYSALNYINGDIRRYFFVSTAVALVLAAVGAQALSSAMRLGFERAGRPAPGRAVAIAVAGVVALAPLSFLPTYWPSAEARAGEEAEPTLAAVLDRVAPDAIVVTEWNMATPLWYARYAENRRPDVLTADGRYVIDHGYGSEANLIRRHLAERPIYLLFPDNVLRNWEPEFTWETLGRVPYEGRTLVRVTGRKG
jgi:hypothetical protein